jgi:hypothetical protein
MRALENWVRPRLILAIIGLSLIIAVLVFVLWPRERVTRQNFGKIWVGMSQAELYQLLGSPHYQIVEIGIVDSPDSYSTNKHLSIEEKRLRGYRDYRRQHWASPKLTISVISDLKGEVVCRYTSQGHTSDWFELVGDRLFGSVRPRPPLVPRPNSGGVAVTKELRK